MTPAELNKACWDFVSGFAFIIAAVVLFVVVAIQVAK